MPSYSSVILGISKICQILSFFMHENNSMFELKKIEDGAKIVKGAVSREFLAFLIL